MTQTPSIAGDSIVRVSQEHVSAELEGETIVLGLRDSLYFGMSGVAERIWQLVQQPRSVDEIVSAIVREYDVERDRCLADTVRFLDRLAERGLVDVTG